MLSRATSTEAPSRDTRSPKSAGKRSAVKTTRWRPAGSAGGTPAGGGLWAGGGGGAPVPGAREAHPPAAPPPPPTPKVKRRVAAALVRRPHTAFLVVSRSA